MLLAAIAFGSYVSAQDKPVVVGKRRYTAGNAEANQRRASYLTPSNQVWLQFSDFMTQPPALRRLGLGVDQTIENP